MRLQIFMTIAFLISAIGLVLGTRSPTSNNSEAQAYDSTLRVEINNVNGLPAGIRLSCKQVRLAQPNQLRDLDCSVQNGSAKDIVAFVIEYTVTGRADGNPWDFSGSISNDILMTTKLFQKRKKDFLAPGRETGITMLPISFDPGHVIERLSVGLTYVEFSDSTSSGDLKAAGLISDRRVGFEISQKLFKKRLADARKKPQKQRTSVSELLQTLEEHSVEFRGLTKNQLDGTKMFRKYVQKLIREEGENSVPDLIS